MIAEEISRFQDQEMQAIRAHRKNGGLVAAYFYPQLPPEILSGLGFFPIRLAEGATYHAEREGEKIIRPDACPYCKSLIGNFKSKHGIFGYADVVVGAVTCDMMRRTLEVISSESGIPVFQLQMPATRSMNSGRYYISEVLRTASDLEKVCGRSFDGMAARRYFDERKSCSEILRRMVSSASLPSNTVHSLMHLFNIARPGQLKLFLKNLEQGRKVRRKKKRILLVGSMICFEDDLLLEILDGKGVEVVISGISENGPSRFYSGAGLKSYGGKKLIMELAERSFRSDVCIRHRPNTEAYSVIKNSGSRMKCDGVILKCLKFCDLWYTEKEPMKQSLDVPLMVLDTTYSDSDEERLRNRIEAFLEII